MKSGLGRELFPDSSRWRTGVRTSTGTGTLSGSFTCPRRLRAMVGAPESGLPSPFLPVLAVETVGEGCGRTSRTPVPPNTLREIHYDSLVSLLRRKTLRHDLSFRPLSALPPEHDRLRRGHPRRTKGGARGFGHFGTTHDVTGPFLLRGEVKRVQTKKCSK